MPVGFQRDGAWIRVGGEHESTCRGRSAEEESYNGGREEAYNHRFDPVEGE
jgi:hypothetical protein